MGGGIGGGGVGKREGEIGLVYKIKKKKMKMVSINDLLCAGWKQSQATQKEDRKENVNFFLM